MASPAVYEGEDAASQNEERELIRRALDALEPELRTVLVLRYFSQLDSKVIGRILGIPDSSVRSRLRTGRQRLAQALRQTGYTDE